MNLYSESHARLCAEMQDELFREHQAMMEMLRTKLSAATDPTERKMLAGFLQIRALMAHHAEVIGDAYRHIDGGFIPPAEVDGLLRPYHRKVLLAYCSPMGNNSYCAARETATAAGEDDEWRSAEDWLVALGFLCETHEIDEGVPIRKPNEFGFAAAERMLAGGWNDD